MLDQIHSIPTLIREIIEPYTDSIQRSLSRDYCQSLSRLFVIGCGDSHHAALATEWAFEELAGLPCEPMTALQFSRYAARFVPSGSTVIGVSVSGGVSRTAEGLMMANQVGTHTIALTANPDGLVGKAAQQTILVTAPPFPEPAGMITPGVRSYAANQIALCLVAIQIGELRGQLSGEDALSLRRELGALAESADRTLKASDGVALRLAQDWRDADEFVFTGGGPNFAAALFSAAKLLEATGDSALGQDTEEWAHLQYFAKAETTPTFIITAGGRDLSRATEVATAAKTIGRRVVAVTPTTTPGLPNVAARTLPFASGVPEMFTPIISAIPCELFAAHRSDVIGEPFFRSFGGGRSIEGGGGISRIRTSEMWDRNP
jgi:glucosamine--fructose-6-phosphate aminotransferase (isomerizing)